MNRSLHCFCFVTVTLLLPVASPIQLAIPLSISAASAQAQTTQDRKAEALQLQELGFQQLDKGQFREALQTFEQALGIVKAIGDRQGEGETLSNIGLVYDNLGQYAQALKLYEQALAIAKEIGDKANEGVILNNIGSVYDKLGQSVQALEYYEQALVIVKQIDDKVTLGSIFNNIGESYRNLGQYAQALKYYQQALEIRPQVGDKLGEAATLNNIGEAYQNLGQYAQALKHYEQALDMAQEMGYKPTEGVIFNNIGSLYRNLGQYVQALKNYVQALDILEQMGDKLGEGTTLNNMGSVYDKLGQYTQALELYEQALKIRQEVGDKLGEAATLNNMGESYRNQGQYDQAVKFYKQALIIFQEIGNRAGEGITLNNIGSVYGNLGQYAQALKSYEEALVIVKQVGDKATEGATLNNIGLIYNNLGRYPDAEKNLLAAIANWESLRPGLTDINKVSIFETQASSYYFLQQALVAQNKTNTALEIAERGRARAFVELLAQRQSSKPNTQQTVESLSSQQIQQIAREQNATLVEYSIVYDGFTNQGKEEWRQSGLYIWVVKPTGEVAFKIVDLKSLKTPLQDLVTSSRDSIGVRGRGGLGVEERKDAANQTEHLQQLHKLLIEPIAQFLPTNPSDRIIFIPQNELFLVPFPALKDASGKYLIEKHTILTAPAIQVLELTHKQRQHVAGKGVLVVGNPTMPSISPQTGQPPQQLPSLPGAEAEANAIASLFNTKAITGNQATKTTVTQQMQKAKIIHLATHGLLDDFKGQGVPGAIALAPSGRDNGLLTSSEIFDMKLNAELVVLSACDTGRGRIMGDSVIGLSRSLISAGVPSVIVSLWSVPDAPTASLMTEFYTQMRQNHDKATALRQAMLATMKQHPNPKNWAAFTLIGEAE